MDSTEQTAAQGSSAIHALLQAAGMPAQTRPRISRLEIRNLGKRYGETTALSNATVTFRPGIHTILGENGSGKSTMLKLLSGTVSPSEGSISIDGVPVLASSPAKMQALGLSTVFQEVLIAPHRSVAENIVLGLDAPLRRHIPHDIRDKAAQAVLSRLGRHPIAINAMAGDLPLAAQQIVVLARAFVRRPSVLLLDEATAALDYADRDIVFDTIEDYAASGNIVIFISHRLAEVQRLSDRVTVLRSGLVTETLGRDRISGPHLLALMAPEAQTDAA